MHTAGDGPTAVESAQTWQPDLLVLDIMLPGFDGLEVCRRVQAQRPVPVLMLTARDDETDMLVGLGVALYERHWNKDTAEATYWLCSAIFNAVIATAIENEDR